MLDVKMGCLGLTQFGYGGCSVGFTDTPIGFGYSWVTRLLGAYDSSNTLTCVTGDPMGSKRSRVLWL